jgi:hypothetical protein
MIIMSISLMTDDALLLFIRSQGVFSWSFDGCRIACEVAEFKQESMECFLFNDGGW